MARDKDAFPNFSASTEFLPHSSEDALRDRREPRGEKVGTPFQKESPPETINLYTDSPAAFWTRVLPNERLKT
jgi:hypothetical protein